jgi:nicotinamidase-related amidase
LKFCTIDRTGGTILHTSRTNPASVKPKDIPSFLRGSLSPEKVEDEQTPRDLTPHILKNLAHLEIDALIPIGGDDTLSYAERLHREGVSVVAIEKTDLERRLRGSGLHRLFVGGLATDYCVLNTVKDAVACGFNVFLLRDAIRAVNVKPHDGRDAQAEMVRLGATPIRLKNLAT